MLYLRLVRGIIPGLLFFTAFARVERQACVELIEERINGILFSYRLDSACGGKSEASLKEQWMIDNKPVLKKEYDDRIAHEQLEELKRDRSREYEKRLEAYSFKNSQRIALFKKILRVTLKEIEEKYGQFERYGVRDYMAYSSDTVMSEIDFVNIPVQFLDFARRLVNSSDEDFSCQRAEALLATLEAYPSKLQVLFENTVKKAIARCNDTERLKKLLEVVS